MTTTLRDTEYAVAKAYYGKPPKGWEPPDHSGHEKPCGKDPVVYFVERESGAIKIGISINLRGRLRTLEAKHGPLKLIGAAFGYETLERLFHQRFDHAKLGGEWFDVQHDEDFFVEMVDALRMGPQCPTTPLGLFNACPRCSKPGVGVYICEHVRRPRGATR